MGELIMMPARHAENKNVAVKPAATERAGQGASQGAAQGFDISVWTKAPRERTAAYFPTYSTVSKAMQTSLRAWVREWFHGNPEILLTPARAYGVLVYICTHPFSGKPTNMFTYDIQQTEALDRAFASAACRLGAELRKLDTKNMPWLTREHYFAYRSKEVVRYVIKNRRLFYKMLNVETMLMDAILKFTLIDIPSLGLEESYVILRRVFNTQLHRFSDQLDLSPRADELIRIATQALVTKMANDNVVQLPLAA
jgi:hypothetical protein